MIIIVVKSKIWIKPDESKYGKTSNTTQITASWDKYVERIIQTRKPSFIYHIPHVIVIWMYTIRVAKLHNELLINILLLLLVLPIYLSMCIGVYSIPHTSIYDKSRLLLETNDETNMLCLQWVSYIPGTTTQDVSVLTRNLHLGNRKFVCPFRNVTGRREPALPSDT